jgi:hypothetical protein
MAKLNHQKRGRPRPVALRRRNTRMGRADFETQTSIERWQRNGSRGSRERADGTSLDTQAPIE